MTVHLHHGNCLDIMQSLSNNYVDLTVTSPPYDKLRKYNDTLNWGEHVWKPVIEHLFRVTKDGGVVVWIVNDSTVKGSETGTSFRQALFAMECGFRLYDTMIWNKMANASIGSMERYGCSFEYMFILSVGKPKSVNLIKDKKNARAGEIQNSSIRKSSGQVVKTSGYGVTPIAEYSRRMNVWNINPCKSPKERLHPAPFSIALVSDHIKSWSNKFDIILDPFMGSGTTGVACQQLDRNFIGIELDVEYFNIAKQRLNIKTITRAK